MELGSTLTYTSMASEVKVIGHRSRSNAKNGNVSHIMSLTAGNIVGPSVPTLSNPSRISNGIGLIL